MSLPKIDKPLFEMTVPSSNTTIKFRPFLVKEEKILLMAQQSDNDRDILTAIKQVLNNCIADPTFNVDTLCTFDLEYMFLKLRAKSVNNIVELSYRDVEDEKVYTFDIDLDQVEIQRNDTLSNKIKINDTVGMIMKYPSVTVLDKAPLNISQTDMVEYLVISCIDQIYDENEVYMISEQSKQEVLDFVDNLSIDVYDKIRNFFDELPKMYYKIEYKNSLGNERTIELTSLRDFFTWG
jgi:hypothetical protein